MSEIRIDAPGAGEWIMERCGGHFVPVFSHTLSTHEPTVGQILGGFVLTDYISNASAMVHMAGDGPGWCTRDLLWMLFEYGFHQLGVRKMFALIRSDNTRSLEMCLRAGWKSETVIGEVFGEGVHGVLLYMIEAECPWLKYPSKTWRIGGRVNTAVVESAVCLAAK